MRLITRKGIFFITTLSLLSVMLALVWSGRVRGRTAVQDELPLKEAGWHLGIGRRDAGDIRFGEGQEVELKWLARVNRVCSVDWQ